MVDPPAETRHPLRQRRRLPQVVREDGDQVEPQSERCARTKACQHTVCHHSVGIVVVVVVDLVADAARAGMADQVLTATSGGHGRRERNQADNRPHPVVAVGRLQGVVGLVVAARRPHEDGAVDAARSPFGLELVGLDRAAQGDEVGRDSSGADTPKVAHVLVRVDAHGAASCLVALRRFTPAGPAPILGGTGAASPLRPDPAFPTSGGLS
jgi:hypothetical protein